MGEPTQDQVRQGGARGEPPAGPGTVHEITNRDPEMAKADPNTANALIVARQNMLIEETQKNTKAILLLVKELRGGEQKSAKPAKD